MMSKDQKLTKDTISAADDAQLHSWTCNKCKATLFVAKGKEWRYFPKNYKCYLCGNVGRDNFSDTRKEVIERVQDDYDFLDPWEALTKTEQKELLEECEGDEERAKQTAIRRAAKALAETKAVEEEAAAAAAEGEETKAEGEETEAEETEVTADPVDAGGEEKEDAAAAATSSPEQEVVKDGVAAVAEGQGDDEDGHDAIAEDEKVEKEEKEEEKETEAETVVAPTAAAAKQSPPKEAPAISE